MQATKTAIVPGGLSGMGRAIAKKLSQTGTRVVIGGRRAGDAAYVRQMLAEHDFTAEAMALDVRSSENVDAFVAEVVRRHGGVDILINAAGVYAEAAVIGHPDSIWDDHIDTNLTGTFRMIRAVMPHMKTAGWGRIVNLSSGWGAFAENLEGPGAYGLAKAALNALTHALPRDLPDGIKVNAMCPGWVATRMGGAAAPLTPEQGADTALWLARLPGDGPTGGFFRRRAPISW